LLAVKTGDSAGRRAHRTLHGSAPSGDLDQRLAGTQQLQCSRKQQIEQLPRAGIRGIAAGQPKDLGWWTEMGKQLGEVSIFGDDISTGRTGRS
jgi:hypothetical protein